MPESDILYNAYLLPTTTDLVRLGFDEKMAEKIIYRIIDGGETSVIAAKPQYFNLVELINSAGLDIPPGIKQKLKTHGFYLLDLCCTFKSHTGSPHPFIWGKMFVKFTNVAGQEQPVTFDICPLNVNDTTQIEKEFGLSALGNFIGSTLSEQYKTLIKFEEIIPIVRAYGKNTSEAWWEYEISESQSDIRGIHEGFIILMFPIDAQVKVTIEVQAKVKENWLQRVRPHSGKWNQEDFAGMEDVELPLYRAVPVTKEELDWKVRFTEAFGKIISGKKELNEADKSIILIKGNMTGNIYSNVHITGNGNVVGEGNVITINQQQLAKIPDEYAKSLQAFSEAVNAQLKKHNVSKEEAAPVQESINELAKEVEGIKREEKINIEKKEDIKSKLTKAAIRLLKILPEGAETLATFTPLAPFSKIIGKGVEEIVKEFQK